MKSIFTQVILACIIATIIMAVPIYFEKYSLVGTQRKATEGYELAKTPIPAAAAETTQTTTVQDNRGFTNIFMMILISLTISFIITIMFIKVRI